MLGENLKSLFPKLKILDLSWNTFENEDFLYIIVEKKFKHLQRFILRRTRVDISEYRLTSSQKAAMKNVELE